MRNRQRAACLLSGIEHERNGKEFPQTVDAAFLQPGCFPTASSLIPFQHHFAAASAVPRSSNGSPITPERPLLDPIRRDRERQPAPLNMPRSLVARVGCLLFPIQPHPNHPQIRKAQTFQPISRAAVDSAVDTCAFDSNSVDMSGWRGGCRSEAIRCIEVEMRCRRKPREWHTAFGKTENMVRGWHAQKQRYLHKLRREIFCSREENGSKWIRFLTLC